MQEHGLTAASISNNERTLTSLNILYKVIIVHPVSHASYSLAALSMTLKLIFNEEGKILGAQGVMCVWEPYDFNYH